MVHRFNWLQQAKPTFGTSQPPPWIEKRR